MYAIYSDSAGGLGSSVGKCLLQYLFRQRAGKPEGQKLV